MDRNALVTVGLALGFLIPISLVGYILIHNDNALSPANSGSIYMTSGPEYNAYLKSGFLSFNTSPSSTNTSVEFIHQAGTGQVDLFNALELFNSINKSNPHDLWVNGTIPPGVTMYLTNTLIQSFSSVNNTNSGMELSGNFSLHLHNPSRGVIYYISFKASATGTESAIFSLKT